MTHAQTIGDYQLAAYLFFVALIVVFAADGVRRRISRRRAAGQRAGRSFYDWERDAA